MTIELAKSDDPRHRLVQSVGGRERAAIEATRRWARLAGGRSRIGRLSGG
jgi:hypothetical protein